MSERVDAKREQGSVVQAVTLRLVHKPGSAAVEADLVYCTEDPYAVSVVFKEPGNEVTWTFSRDLIATGIHSPSGIGDVLLWPCLDDGGNAVVMLELVSPDGSALLEGQSSDISTFVQRALALVPLGEESALLDVDAAVASLLT
ncbi:SsgA family sporulation/cell division regulator [Nocardioides terrisoli]|uniref:SsgA family sporulation/cell division regulator n=1 Tax=Nocardioides terrisoli TaxID=3388267 RepID=UPI00287B945D|nr:SsgA family sporulation/cell division regulator [Nocardioides marmorisolisilvae]